MREHKRAVWSKSVPACMACGRLFTATGIAGVKALLADARRMDPEAYASLREELGPSPATENTEGE
jgi:hypothetical protein